MRVLPILLATLLSAPAAFAASLEVGGDYGAIDAERDTSPMVLAELFCAARVTGDMSALEPFFAPKLIKLLGLAADKPEIVAAALPDGIPWQSHPETPVSCTPEVLFGIDDAIGVLVRITYSAPGGTWSDTLNLDRTPDSWRINNVLYDTGGNLRFTLLEALSG